MESSVKIFIPNIICSDLVDSEQGSTSNSSEKQLPHSADDISGKRGNWVTIGIKAEANQDEDESPDSSSVLCLQWQEIELTGLCVYNWSLLMFEPFNNTIVQKLLWRARSQSGTVVKVNCFLYLFLGESMANIFCKHIFIPR